MLNGYRVSRVGLEGMTKMQRLKAEVRAELRSKKMPSKVLRQVRNGELKGKAQQDAAFERHTGFRLEDEPSRSARLEILEEHARAQDVCEMADREWERERLGDCDGYTWLNEEHDPEVHDWAAEDETDLRGW